MAGTPAPSQAGPSPVPSNGASTPAAPSGPRVPADLQRVNWPGASVSGESCDVPGRVTLRKGGATATSSTHARVHLGTWEDPTYADVQGDASPEAILVVQAVGEVAVDGGGCCGFGVQQPAYEGLDARLERLAGRGRRRREHELRGSGGQWQDLGGDDRDVDAEAERLVLAAGCRTACGSSKYSDAVSGSSALLEERRARGPAGRSRQRVRAARPAHREQRTSRLPPRGHTLLNQRSLVYVHLVQPLGQLLSCAIA